MIRTSKGLRDIGEALRKHLLREGLALDEVDRRLGWKAGHLQELLDSEEGLRIDQLREVLGAAEINEQVFFADLYDLTPKASKGEIPYSTGMLSEEDVAVFPPAHEVLGLFRMLVQEGLRDNLRESGTGSVTGGDFPEDRPPRSPRRRKRS